MDLKLGNVTITLLGPERIAEVINQIAEYLESDELPPNHWKEDKRHEFYSLIRIEMTMDACRMVDKLSHTK